MNKVLKRECVCVCAMHSIRCSSDANDGMGDEGEQMVFDFIRMSPILLFHIWYGISKMRCNKYTSKHIPLIVMQAIMKHSSFKLLIIDLLLLRVCVCVFECKRNEVLVAGSYMPSISPFLL